MLRNTCATVPLWNGVNRQRYTLQWKLACFSATGLAIWSTDAAAMAPVYFDLGGLLVGIALIILAVGGGLAYLLGKGKGVAIFTVLVLTALIWFDRDVSQEKQRNAEAFRVAEFTKNARCLSEAGESGVASDQRVFQQVFVQIGADVNALASDLRRQDHLDNVQYVNVFPLDRIESAAYVDISGFTEAIPNAGRRLLSGIKVVVSDSSGNAFAQRTEINIHNGVWCMSRSLSTSTERFVKNWVGQKIGMSRGEDAPWSKVQDYSPIATVTEPVKGRFGERVRRPRLSTDENVPGLKSLLSTMNCAGSDRKYGDRSIVCAQNTEDENTIDPSTVIGLHESGDSWLLIHTTTSVFFIQSLDVVERSRTGVVTNEWRLRFKGISSVKQFPVEQLRGVNIQRKGGEISLDLLASRHWDTLSPVPPSGNEYNEWYDYKATVSASLTSRQSR